MEMRPYRRYIGKQVIGLDRQRIPTQGNGFASKEFLL
jgi:hypothetical protein